MDQTRGNGEPRVRTPEEQTPDWEGVPRELPVTRKCNFPFCDDDTSPLPLPLSHGELTQLSLKQPVPSSSSFPPLSTNPYAGTRNTAALSREQKLPVHYTHSLSPTTSGPCPHPGPRRLTSHPPPVQSPPSRSDSGLVWGSVSHPENLPLIPTDSAPASLNTHRHTQSEADTTQPTHRSPSVPRNFPSRLPPRRPLPAPGSPGAALTPVLQRPTAGPRSTLTSTLALGQE